MSKYFDGDKVSGYEDSPITYVYGGNLEECHKKIADLEAKLAESKEREKGQKELRQIMSEEKNMNFLRYIEMCVKNEQLEQQLAEHNEYFRSFSCEKFNEFKDFISTFMLTPHEEQTLIKELKQQLAEKDEQLLCKSWYKQYKNVMEANEGFYNECAKLREQLAEKDAEIRVAYSFRKQKCDNLQKALAEKEKEIEKLKQRLQDTIKIYSDDFVEKDKELKELRYKVSKIDQDKISFAIAELEKVKNRIQEDFDYDDLMYWLNNQIASLKKGVE